MFKLILEPDHFNSRLICAGLGNGQVDCIIISVNAQDTGLCGSHDPAPKRKVLFPSLFLSFFFFFFTPSNTVEFLWSVALKNSFQVIETISIVHMFCSAYVRF